jgi:carbon storage regulator
MLVLTRKTNESIYIDGGIEVMVVQVRGNRVRLGFRAPSDVSIQRKERMVEKEPMVESATPAPTVQRFEDASAPRTRTAREVRSHAR